MDHHKLVERGLLKYIYNDVRASDKEVEMMIKNNPQPEYEINYINGNTFNKLQSGLEDDPNCGGPIANRSKAPKQGTPPQE